MASVIYRSPWLLASKGIQCSTRQAKKPIYLKPIAVTFSSQSSRQQLQIKKDVDLSNSDVEHKRLESNTESILSESSQSTPAPSTEAQVLSLSDLPSPNTQQLATTNTPSPQPDASPVRWPRAVQAVFLKPLRRDPTHGHPSCDLQMRSYSVRNLDFFTDFALRAAYYLKLPAFGPVPLPRIVERWTVPKSNFVHKKSQENFERVTCRRLIQIKDGHPDTVELWLSYLRKHAFHGVGMKANMYTFGTYNLPKAQVRKEKAQEEISTSPKDGAIPSMSPGNSPMTSKANNAGKLKLPPSSTPPTASRNAASNAKSARATKNPATPRLADRTNPIQGKSARSITGTAPQAPRRGGRKR